MRLDWQELSDRYGPQPSRYIEESRQEAERRRYLVPVAYVCPDCGREFYLSRATIENARRDNVELVCGPCKERADRFEESSAADFPPLGGADDE